MSSVFAFVRRHKGKLAVAGAALGAAVYYVHTQIEERRLAALQETVSESALGRDARRTFVLESQQRTADETIASLMDSVWRRLRERFDVESIVRVIQQSDDMSIEEKVCVHRDIFGILKSRHFERMCVGALARAIVAAHALAAVCLTLKVQVSMVAGQTFADRPTSTLDTNAQHAFLQCSHYFVTRSLNTLCDEVEVICREAVKEWPITSLMSFEQLSTLVYNIRRNVHCDIADLMAPPSLGDAHLSSLLTTLRLHVDDDASSMCAKEIVSHSIARFVDGMREHMDEPVRLVKMIPHMAREYDRLADVDDFEAPLAHALASLTLHDVTRRVFDDTVGGPIVTMQ